MNHAHRASRLDGLAETYRRVWIESKFGKLTAFVTDGHLPYPYGREMTGYEVANLTDTLAKAKAAGVDILVAPHHRLTSEPLRLCNSRVDILPRSTQSRADRRTEVEQIP